MRSQKHLGVQINMFSSVFEIGWIIITCFGTVKGTFSGKFRRVHGMEDLSKGQTPSYSLSLDTKTSCAAFASRLKCKLVSFQEENKRCNVYTQRGPVRSVSTDEIFYTKDLEADFTFSEAQNTWYKFYSCSACYAVDAIRICRNQNAQVIYINSLARQQFLENVLQGKRGVYLIDGNDYDRNNRFTHSNGALMTYFDFASSEPSRTYGEDCLAVVDWDNFKWHDITCGTEELGGVVCEIPPWKVLH